MRLRNFILIAWLALGASASLIIWQLNAFVADQIPKHLLPFVYLFSGTQEAVPVAYTWALRIGFLSVVMFFVSLLALVGAYLIRRFSSNREVRDA